MTENSGSGLTYKIVLGVIALAVAITIACIADAYHKINEGNVGIYYKYGALQDRVSEPGVHFLQPFVDSYKEVMIRPETLYMPPILASTKDGIETTFREITAITKVSRDKLIFMLKSFGPEFKNSLVFDRIKQELREFCANKTIDQVYNTEFLTIVAHVQREVNSSIVRLGQGGIEILNLAIPKPEIPIDIAERYKEVKVQWAEQLVATQQQKTEGIKKETERIKAIADAEREKEVLEIKIEQKILDEEGKKNISLINNAIKKAAEENEANIANFKLLKEAEANEKLFTEQYVKLNLAKSLSENTKLFFSGEGSEMGALFNKILKN